MRHTSKTIGTLLCAALLASAAFAQQNIITTKIGGGPNDIPALDADVNDPQGINFDSAGNYYFGDCAQNRVFKVNTSGILSVVAGTGIPGYAGDGVTGGAAQALLNCPFGVAADASGNVYIADTYNSVVRKVDTSNTITTIAGNYNDGCTYNGNGSPATSFDLCHPQGLALDHAGNLYIADEINSLIRKVVISSSTISNFAGTGVAGYSGDGGLATAAMLYYPVAIAIDTAGDVFIADTSNYRIREVTASNKKIKTVAGTGTAGYTGDGLAATNATVNAVYGIAVNTTGTKVTIADTYNAVIRQFTVGGTIATVGGGAGTGWCGDGMAALSTCFYYPYGVAVNAAGTIYVADTSNDRIRQFTIGGNINTVAGNGTTNLTTPVTGIPAQGVVLYDPWAVFEDPTGNIFVADQYNSLVSELALSSGLVNFFAGDGIYGYHGDGGKATSANLSYPSGIARDSNGNVYIADTQNCAVRMVDTSGNISTVAGNGICGYSGDGGLATSAQLNAPYSVFVDRFNTVYISDTYNNVVRKVYGGAITTIAGDGTPGWHGDGSPATAAQLYYPFAVSEDGAGNLYIADYNNCRIREISAATGIIETVAGSVVCGYSGDGMATENALYYPSDIKADSNGNLFIADTGNQRLRWVTPSGIMTTFAGTGAASFSGDGGAAENADFYSPVGLFEDPAGNFLVADQYNLRIRNIAAFAGLGTSANSLTFGVLPVGSASEPQALTLSGVGPLTIGAILVSGPFQEADNCGSTLPNGQTCTVYVYFKPTASGAAAGTLTIENNGYFNGAAVVSLEGTGSALSISGAPVSFGNQLEKTTSAVQTVTVANKGTTSITMGSITLSETTDFAIASNTCPASGNALAAGGSCAIGLTFTPKTTGAKKGVLSIGDSDPTSPQLAGVSGTGTSNISFSPAAVSFAAQAIGTTSTSARIVLTNKSGAAITLGNPAVSLSGPFVNTSSTTCTNGKSVANNGTCLIYVSFAPTSAGYAAGTLSVADTDATSPQTVALTGIGTGVKFSPSTLTFGSVNKGTQTSTAVTITNVGLHALTFTGSTISGSIPTDFATNVGEPPCGGTLAPGAVCSFTVYFAPSIVGNESATFQLYDNSAGSPQGLPMTGAGQ